MSTELFPMAMNGYTFDSLKKPTFNNITHTPVAGTPVHIALGSDSPVYEFTLSNNWLTNADKETLLGFFLKRRGSFDSFFYYDEDCIFNNEPFGATDGVAQEFQLKKSIGSFEEPINYKADETYIYKNGALLEKDVDYFDYSTGYISFSVPPDEGDILTWTGTAYYKCRFIDDSQEYNQFMSRLYECNEITFKGSLRDLV